MNDLKKAEEKARNLVTKYVAANTATGWLPLSLLWQGGLDWKMISSIAQIFRITLSEDDNKQIKATIATLVASKGISEGLVLVPGVGWIAKSAAAAISTKAVGEYIIYYCKKRSPLP